jgi:heat shock protein HtpX
MASALNRLRAMRDAPSQLPKELNAFGIRGGGMRKLMATHPPLEERIARLQAG